jgi:hypothetical protein
MAWILVVIGIAFPRIGTFLISFVPLPERVDDNLVRVVMLAAALLLPAGLGAMSLLLKDRGERPAGAAAKTRAILKGYPFTLGLAATLVLMTLFAPVLKVRALARRWTSQHVPMIVESRDYDAVVGEVRAALHAGGWETRRERASWMLRAPTKVLTLLAGGSVENLVAEKLTTLRGDALEVMLHPSDLVIQGRAPDTLRARATLAERLAFSRAHLTWTKQAMELEGRIRAVWRDVRARRVDAGAAVGRLRAIEARLREVQVASEEWEVLCRARLLVEVAARETLGERAEVGPVRRTVVPLSLALARQALAGPAVRSAVDQAIIRLVRRVAGRDECPPAAPRAPADRPLRAA